LEEISEININFVEIALEMVPIHGEIVTSEDIPSHASVY
jgi:hypothetical protein